MNTPVNHIGPALLTLCAASAFATPDGVTNQVQDAGFESTSSPLRTFGRAPGDPWLPGEWNAENATLIVGSSAGITPHSPDGMLRVNNAGGVGSQLSHVMDISSCAADIDSGSVLACYSIWVNPAAAGVSPTIILNTGESQSIVGTMVPAGGTFVTGFNRSSINGFAADGDPNTWEEIRGAFALPSGTRFMALHIAVNNSQIPAGGVFFDTTSVVLKTCEMLADNSFDSGAAPLQPFFRGGGDPPWTPGEWNAESANLIVGSSAGVSPLFGDGMLRVNSTVGVGSQVSQIIDVQDYAQSIDTGGIAARMFGWFNAATGASQPRISLIAGESQNANGTLVPVGGSLVSGFNRVVLPATADGDAFTWEARGSTFGLPSGTRFLHYELIGVNATTPPTGLFFDDASVCFRAALPTNGLTHTALGNATLAQESGTGNLLVDNIGSSGEDGVSVSLGESSGWAVATDILIDNPGDSMTTSLIGSVNGVADQVMATATIEGTASGANLQVSFPAIGTSGTLYELFDANEVLVGSFVVDPALRATDITTENDCPSGQISPICESYWNCDSTSFSWIVRWCIDECLGVTNPSTGEVFTGITSISVSALDIVGTMDYSSEVTVQFTGVGSVPFSQEWIQNSPEEALGSALGSAHINSNSAGLFVDNIGSSGMDGIALDSGLPNTSNDIEDDQFIAFSGDWDPIDPTDSAPAGATLALSTSGFFGGSQQDTGSLIISNIGSSGKDGVRVTPDYTAVGSSSVDIEVLSGGISVLLATGVDNTGGAAATTVTDPGGPVPWPTHSEATLIAPSAPPIARGPGDPFNGIDTNLNWAQPVSISIPGQGTVLGDQLHFIPLGATSTFEGIESVSITAGDIPSLTITSTSFTAAATPCDGDANGDGTVDVNDISFVLFRLGGPAPDGDANGDGVIDVNDISFVLFRLGNPCP